MDYLLQINIELSGYLKGRLKFSPKMIKSWIKNDRIYLPSAFTLTHSLLRKVFKSYRNPAYVLTNPDKIKEIKTYINKKSQLATTMSDEERKQNLLHNIKFIVNNLIGIDSVLTINNKELVIIDNKLYDKYLKNISLTKKLIHITARLTVIEKKKDSDENRKKVGCYERKRIINNIYSDLFGKSLFSIKDPIHIKHLNNTS